jgi:hypothetical protein
LTESETSSVSITSIASSPAGGADAPHAVNTVSDSAAVATIERGAFTCKEAIGERADHD